MKAIFKSICVLALPVILFSCRKKPDPVIVDPPATNREVHINFVNFAGIDTLMLAPQDSFSLASAYTNIAGEAFSVSIFNYYISNVRLVNAGSGTDYVEKESYHLIREGVSASRHFHLKDVPQGSYKSITFLVGVDSARNVSGAQTGALSVDHGMFWTWNTGYIMAKMEGKSSDGKSFKYHPGGFKGQTSVLRTVTLDFPSPVVIGANTNGDVVIRADALKWFDADKITIAKVNTVMNPGDNAVRIADNYSGMFNIISAQSTTE